MPSFVYLLRLTFLIIGGTFKIVVSDQYEIPLENFFGIDDNDKQPFVVNGGNSHSKNSPKVINNKYFPFEGESTNWKKENETTISKRDSVIKDQLLSGSDFHIEDDPQRIPVSSFGPFNDHHILPHPVEITTFKPYEFKDYLTPLHSRIDEEPRVVEEKLFTNPDSSVFSYLMEDHINGELHNDDDDDDDDDDYGSDISENYSDAYYYDTTDYDEVRKAFLDLKDRNLVLNFYSELKKELKNSSFVLGEEKEIHESEKDSSAEESVIEISKKCCMNFLKKVFDSVNPPLTTPDLTEIDETDYSVFFPPLLEEDTTFPEIGIDIDDVYKSENTFLGDGGFPISSNDAESSLTPFNEKTFIKDELNIPYEPLVFESGTQEENNFSINTLNKPTLNEVIKFHLEKHSPQNFNRSTLIIIVPDATSNSSQNIDQNPNFELNHSFGYSSEDQKIELDTSKDEKLSQMIEKNHYTMDSIDKEELLSFARFLQPVIPSRLHPLIVNQIILVNESPKSIEQFKTKVTSGKNDKKFMNQLKYLDDDDESVLLIMDPKEDEEKVVSFPVQDYILSPERRILENNGSLDRNKRLANSNPTSLKFKEEIEYNNSPNPPQTTPESRVGSEASYNQVRVSHLLSALQNAKIENDKMNQRIERRNQTNLTKMKYLEVFKTVLKTTNGPLIIVLPKNETNLNGNDDVDKLISKRSAPFVKIPFKNPSLTGKSRKIILRVNFKNADDKAFSPGGKRVQTSAIPNLNFANSDFEISSSVNHPIRVVRSHGHNKTSPFIQVDTPVRQQIRTSQPNYPIIRGSNLISHNNLRETSKQSGRPQHITKLGNVLFEDDEILVTELPEDLINEDLSDPSTLRRFQSIFGNNNEFASEIFIVNEKGCKILKMVDSVFQEKKCDLNDFQFPFQPQFGYPLTTRKRNKKLNMQSTLTETNLNTKKFTLQPINKPSIMNNKEGSSLRFYDKPSIPFPKTFTSNKKQIENYTLRPLISKFSHGMISKSSHNNNNNNNNKYQKNNKIVVPRPTNVKTRPTYQQNLNENVMSKSGLTTKSKNVKRQPEMNTNKRFVSEQVKKMNDFEFQQNINGHKELTASETLSEPFVLNINKLRPPDPQPSTKTSSHNEDDFSSLIEFIANHHQKNVMDDRLANALGKGVDIISSMGNVFGKFHDHIPAPSVLNVLESSITSNETENIISTEQNVKIQSVKPNEKNMAKIHFQNKTLGPTKRHQLLNSHIKENNQSLFSFVDGIKFDTERTINIEFLVNGEKEKVTIPYTTSKLTESPAFGDDDNNLEVKVARQIPVKNAEANDEMNDQSKEDEISNEFSENLLLSPKNETNVQNYTKDISLTFLGNGVYNLDIRNFDYTPHRANESDLILHSPLKLVRNELKKVPRKFENNTEEAKMVNSKEIDRFKNNSESNTTLEMILPLLLNITNFKNLVSLLNFANKTALGPSVDSLLSKPTSLHVNESSSTEETPRLSLKDGDIKQVNISRGKAIKYSSKTLSDNMVEILLLNYDSTEKIDANSSSKMESKEDDKPSLNTRNSTKSLLATNNQINLVRERSKSREPTSKPLINEKNSTSTSENGTSPTDRANVIIKISINNNNEADKNGNIKADNIYREILLIDGNGTVLEEALLDDKSSPIREFLNSASKRNVKKLFDGISNTKILSQQSEKNLSSVPKYSINSEKNSTESEIVNQTMLETEIVKATLVKNERLDDDIGPLHNRQRSNQKPQSVIDFMKKMLPSQRGRSKNSNFNLAPPNSNFGHHELKETHHGLLPPLPKKKLIPHLQFPFLLPLEAGEEKQADDEEESESKWIWTADDKIIKNSRTLSHEKQSTKGANMESQLKSFVSELSRFVSKPENLRFADSKIRPVKHQTGVAKHLHSSLQLNPSVRTATKNEWLW